MQSFRKIGVCWFGGVLEVLLESEGSYYTGIYSSYISTYLDSLDEDFVRTFYSDTILLPIDNTELYIYLEGYPKEKLQFLYNNPWNDLEHDVLILDDGRYMSRCRSWVYDFIMLEIQGYGKTETDAILDMDKIISVLNMGYDEEKVKQFMLTHG